MVGYEGAGFRLWDPEDDSVVVERNVLFNGTARGVPVHAALPAGDIHLNILPTERLRGPGDAGPERRW